MQPRVPDGLAYGLLLHAPEPGGIAAFPARHFNGLDNKPLQSCFAPADTTAIPYRVAAGVDKADRHTGLKAGQQGTIAPVNIIGRNHSRQALEWIDAGRPAQRAHHKHIILIPNPDVAAVGQIQRLDAHGNNSVLSVDDVSSTRPITLAWRRMARRNGLIWTAQAA